MQNVSRDICKINHMGLIWLFLVLPIGDFESVLEVRNLFFFLEVNSVFVFVLIDDIESS